MTKGGRCISSASFVFGERRMQGAEEDRVSTSKHVLANFSRHRFTRLSTMKVQQRAEQCELS